MEPGERDLGEAGPPAAEDPAATRRRPSPARAWLLTLLLYLPALLPVGWHLLDRDGLEPSGFLHPELPYYTANAREHFDDGTFHATYGLPFSSDPGTPRIYVQPQSLLLAVLMRLGLDPAAALLLVGTVAGLLCVRLALCVLGELVPISGAAGALTAACFVWGGGLFVALGALTAGSGGIEDVFRLMPDGGGWFLNLGLNLLMPTEAQYHALWLLAALLVLRGRTWAAIGTAAVLCASHPFTGLELACVLAAWLALEALWIRNPRVRIAHLVATVALIAAHLAYYVAFLGSFAEHAVVKSQWIEWTQWWTIEADAFVPELALVALLAAWRMRTPALALGVLADPRARFVATWGMVAFLLANNEFALSPNVQPLHFDRGYPWMALFLLGAPVLSRALAAGLAARRRVAVAAAVLLLLSDSAAFVGTFHWRERTTIGEVGLRPGFRELAAWLGDPSRRDVLVLIPPLQDLRLLPLLVLSYTPARTWASHPYNTPHAEERHAELLHAFRDGVFVEEWAGRRLVLVMPRDAPIPPWASERGARREHRAGAFDAWVVEPR